MTRGWILIMMNISFEDCDDNDANIGFTPEDIDCDGITNDIDCDETNGIDTDCDRISTEEDCDDSNALDKDCDGIEFDLDCDDNSVDFGSIVFDSDCDRICRRRL